MSTKNSKGNEISNKSKSQMQKIQSEIKDIVISKLLEKVISQEKELKLLRDECQTIKTDLMILIRKILTEKKNYPLNILKTSKLSILNTCSSPPPKQNQRTHSKIKNSFLSPTISTKNKLNISGYCASETQTNFSLSCKNQKTKDFVNTLYRRNNYTSKDFLNSSQISSYNNNTIATGNNGTLNGGDNDLSLVTSRRQNLSNLSSFIVQNEVNKRYPITVNNKFKKKVSLTKLSYRPENEKEFMKMSTQNKNSKVINYTSPNIGIKGEKNVNYFKDSKNKYNNKVNRKATK